MSYHLLKVLKLAFKRKRCNKYDYIFSLGYNCEIAFRFVKYFKFEESNLFNWMYVLPFERLLNAINNLDKIGTEGFRGPNPLWHDNFSGIHFHGKASFDELKNNPQIIEKDLEDLKSRIPYLAQKFKKFLTSDYKKLYICKLKGDDIDTNINKKIKCLNDSLYALGGKNFDILVVTEEKYKDFFKNPDGFIYRTVTQFPPDTNAVSPDFFNNGWNEIFDEFYVKKPKKTKKKHYKFD